MSATDTENHPWPERRVARVRKLKPKVRPVPDLPEGVSAAAFNEATRRAVTWQMAALLDDGVGLARRMCSDPVFSGPDERVTATLTAARIINANASLGRALATLTQVEQRRRTLIEHVEPSKPWNDSNSIEEGKIIRELQFKMWRYLKMLTDESLTPELKDADDRAADIALREARRVPAPPA